MSIYELVPILHMTYQMNDFDKVEKELVNKEVKHRTKVRSYGKKIKL